MRKIVFTGEICVNFLTISPVVKHAIDEFDPRDVVVDQPPVGDVCDSCGSNTGHDWTCPVGVDEAAEHIVKRSRPLLRKIFPGRNTIDDVTQTIREYAEVYGQYSPQCMHWKLVLEKINSIGGIT